MKIYLPNAALIIICLSSVAPIAAACPEGKSEVVIVTPNGVSKTICVSDNAIPGIENAAENTGQFTISAACPCLDLWDGPPYPVEAEVFGTPPVLPDQFPDEYWCETVDPLQGLGYGIAWIDPQTGYETQFAVFSSPEEPDGSDIDACLTLYGTGSESAGQLGGPFKTLFPDMTLSETGEWTSELMNACQALLEVRGFRCPTD